MPGWGQESQYSPDIQEIQRRGKLVVALLNREQAPFFYRDERNELVGLDVMLAKGIADGLGVELEFNRSAESFNGLVGIVAQGKADMVISKLSRTSSRTQLVRFTEPYIVLRQALLLNRLQLAEEVSEEKIPSFIRSFTGKMGVVANSSYLVFAQRNFPEAQIVEFPTWEQVVEAVFSGDILAAYRDELEIKKIIKARPDSALRLKTVVLTDTEDNIAIAVNWKSEQLLYWTNLYLQSLKLNYTAESLLNEHSDIFE